MGMQKVRTLFFRKAHLLQKQIVQGFLKVPLKELEKRIAAVASDVSLSTRDEEVADLRKILDNVARLGFLFW
jgi:hypothetical protein